MLTKLRATGWHYLSGDRLCRFSAGVGPLRAAFLCRQPLQKSTQGSKPEQDYDSIDLEVIPDDYRAPTTLNADREEYLRRVSRVSWTEPGRCDPANWMNFTF